MKIVFGTLGLVVAGGVAFSVVSSQKDGGSVAGDDIDLSGVCLTQEEEPSCDE